MIEIEKSHLNGRPLLASKTFITNGVWAIKKNEVLNFLEGFGLSFVTYEKHQPLEEKKVLALIPKKVKLKKYVNTRKVENIKGYPAYLYMCKKRKAPLLIRKEYVDVFDMHFGKEVWALNEHSVAFSKNVKSKKENVAMIMPLRVP